MPGMLLHNCGVGKIDEELDQVSLIKKTPNHHDTYSGIFDAPHLFIPGGFLAPF
jgi:hypothetical protein